MSWWEMNADRDAEVLDAVLRGEPIAEVAETFGMTPDGAIMAAARALRSEELEAEGRRAEDGD